MKARESKIIPEPKEVSGFRQAPRQAEVTAYLSLVFILLMAFAGAMIESASIQNAKNYRRADMNRAIESVFAEYQKELLEEYDIFALEGTYETGNYSESQVLDRLSYYGAENMEQDVKRIQLLTDRGAQTFYQQAAAYMEHKYGLAAFREMEGDTAVWRQQEQEAKACQIQEKEQKDELTELLKEEGAALPEQDNPISHVDQLRESPILELVLPKEIQVSEKSINLEETVSHRNLQEGYGDFSDVAEDGGVLSDLLFGEYLMDHFDMAVGGDKTGALDYELEYILAGKESDRENLGAVADRLVLLRFVPNYAHLQSSAKKKGEARALAGTLCSLLAVPAVTEAAAQAILLAWAFGESVVDVRTLLKGNKVPLIKSEESWQLSLSGLMELGSGEEAKDGRDAKDGLAYRDYLRMLLFLESKEKTGVRALDLIEQNLKTEHGLGFFRADQCISRIEVESTCRLRRGITYRFSTYFGYR